jgi:hypothetical protein
MEPKTMGSCIFLTKEPMMFRWLRRNPRYDIEQRRRIFDALVDYPLYEPPHRQGPNNPRHTRGQGEESYRRFIQEHNARSKENFAHFMTHREARLTALASFFRKFAMIIGVDDRGLSAVSAWCPGNCGALVPNLADNATRQAFFQLAPWTEQWRGLNVIFDLGIFLGECVLIRNRKLYWTFFPGSSDDGFSNLSGYHIAGYRSIRDRLDAPEYMYSLCENDASMQRWPGFDRSRHINDLAGIVRDRSTR